MKEPPKKNFIEWLSDKCLRIWEREGIWIEEHWELDELEAFLCYGDPYVYDIGIRDDDEIWRAYWTAILNIAYEISGTNHRWEFFSDPDDYDGVAVVVVDKQGRCLTCGSDGSVAARLTMRDHGDIDGFRQFIINLATQLFGGGKQ
ncbi:hypothetical protein GG496_001502 [Candidatus Fervidibacteria bacterium JGI MDM2 JNZ-1-D12]